MAEIQDKILDASLAFAKARYEAGGSLCGNIRREIFEAHLEGTDWTYEEANAYLTASRIENATSFFKKGLISKEKFFEILKNA